MSPRWLRIAPLVLAASSAHIIVGRTERAPTARPRSVLSEPLRPLLLLRGGADEALPEPEAAAAPVEKEPPLEMKGEPPVTCWSAVCQVVKAIRSLLSPTYEYAKKDTDILGDTSQMAGFAADDESWRTQRKKLHQITLSAPVQKRVLRDLRILKRETDIGVEVEDCECLTDWVVKIVGAKGTVFEGEIYRLRVRFHADYPTQPPEVTFMRPAPVHEHIYSDGKICLNILYSDWDPKMDVKSMCLSLLSMLSSAKKKGRPPDNDSTVVMSQGQKTRNMQWEFHDDNC